MRLAISKKGFKINRQQRQSHDGCLMFWGIVIPNQLIATIEVQNRFNANKYTPIQNFYI